MTLLSAATIAELTRLEESAMNETFTVTYVTRVDDGGGASSETTTTTTTSGYMWSVSGDEAGADQIKARGKHRIAVPKTLSIPATARITQNTTGIVYAIKYVFPVTTYSTSLMLGVEERG